MSITNIIEELCSRNELKDTTLTDINNLNDNDLIIFLRHLSSMCAYCNETFNIPAKTIFIVKFISERLNMKQYDSLYQMFKTIIDINEDILNRKYDIDNEIKDIYLYSNIRQIPIHSIFITLYNVKYVTIDLTINEYDFDSFEFKIINHIMDLNNNFKYIITHNIDWNILNSNGGFSILSNVCKSITTCVNIINQLIYYIMKFLTTYSCLNVVFPFCDNKYMIKMLIDNDLIDVKDKYINYVTQYDVKNKCFDAISSIDYNTQNSYVKELIMKDDSDKFVSYTTDMNYNPEEMIYIENYCKRLSLLECSVYYNANSIFSYLIKEFKDKDSWRYVRRLLKVAINAHNVTVIHYIEDNICKLTKYFKVEELTRLCRKYYNHSFETYIHDNIMFI